MNLRRQKSATQSAADVSRARLARISKTRRHRARNSVRIFKYGAKSFVRNTWLSIAAVAIMAVTLLVLSATIVATSALSTAAHEIESQIDMSVYVVQSASKAQVDRITARLSALSSVIKVTAISPEAANNEAINKLIAENNLTDPDYISELRKAPNKLPWTINVKLKNLNLTGELENFVNHDESMINMLDARRPSYASKHRATIDRIASVINRIKFFGLIAASVFAVIAVLVVFNTIRMAIFNRKEEIYMMKLVGASHWFIIGPFLVEASLYGIVAALIAAAGIYATVFALQPSLSGMIDPAANFMRAYWYLVLPALALVGALIGIFSALLAARKYIRRLN